MPCTTIQIPKIRLSRQNSGAKAIAPMPSPGQESPAGADGAAPATKELVDTETRRIIEECYEQALVTLRGSRDRLDRLARTLLDRETLEEDEAYAAAGISPGTAPAVIARGEAPGTTTGPGAPPTAAQAGADHIAPAPRR